MFNIGDIVLVVQDWTQVPATVVDLRTHGDIVLCKVQFASGVVDWFDSDQVTGKE